MKTVTMEEMRTVNGGATATCSYCGKVFKDKKFLWIVYSYARVQLEKHYAFCAKAKRQRLGY